MIATYPDTGGATRSRRGSGSVVELLEFLQARDLLIAPHVAARLLAELDGDQETIAEVVCMLSPGERRGTRALPDPLPLTPAITARFTDLVLAPWERRTLLAAAVCIDDRTEVLRAVSSRSMADIIGSEISSRLLLVAGHFAFIDPRLRVWVHETADLAERTAIHSALHGVYSEIGDDRRALWHLSLSTMQGESALTRPLLELSRHAAASGDAVQAFAVAREAAAHADPTDLVVARSAAGMAALRGGWVDDAADFLGVVVEDGSLRGSSPDSVAAAGLVVANTLRSGTVPVVDAARLRPTEAGAATWRDWGRLAALLAMLSTERNAGSESRKWAGMAREADTACTAGGALSGPADAWAAMLAGDAVEDIVGDAPLRCILLALCRGLSGDTDGGIRLLADDDRIGLRDSEARGFERSPVAGAYRATVEALLRLWAGDVGAAHEILMRAALAVPLALPFAGLGVMLTGLVEQARTGRRGAVSQALEFALPQALRTDRLVEDGVSAYLEGRFDEAATQVRLWADCGAPSACLGLPGLDEVGPILLPTLIEPADVTAARRIRIQIRAARANAWGQDYQAAADASRTIRSSFERGRVEALLGTTCVTRGDLGAGVRHLQAARSLFTAAGAEAWRSAVDARLARLGELVTERSSLPTAPIPVCSADPLAACRAAWEPVLTDRELQVAMLVAEGNSNREIALRLHVSVRTVEVHVGRLFGKFDVRTRAELTVLAHRTNQYA